MTVKPALDQAMTEDIFVPTPFIIINPNKKLFTMTLGPNAIAQFFPACDYVLIERQKKRLFSTSREMGLVCYETIMESLRHLLDDHGVSR